MRILYKIVIETYCAITFTVTDTKGSSISLSKKRTERSTDQRFLHILCSNSKHNDKEKHAFSYFRYPTNFNIKATYKLYLNILTSSS